MYRRIFAWILAFVMVFSLLPGTALATDGTPETEPTATEAQETEPQATELETTEQEATEPEATEPEATEPEATEPEATEPEATEPEVTEPEETEPQATQPVETQPAPDQKVKFTNPGKRNTEITSVTAKFSFEFPEGSGLMDEDVGSIAVVLQIQAGEDWVDFCEKSISVENGWTATFNVTPYEDYSLCIRDANLDGYDYELVGNTSINLEPETKETRAYTIRYTEIVDDPDDNDDYDDGDECDREDCGILTVTLVFAEDSALTSEQVGDIRVHAESDMEGGGNATLSHESGRTAQLSLFGSRHTIDFRDYNVGGYTCSIVGDEEVVVKANENTHVTYTIRYVKKDEAKLTVSLDITESSVFGDDEIGAVTVTATDVNSDTEKCVELTVANGRTADISLYEGTWQISVTGPQKDGYVCYVSGSYEIELVGGENASERYTIEYLKDEAKVSVALSFSASSAFGDADIGSITANIYNVDDEIVKSLALTQANGRVDEAILPTGDYYIIFEGYEKEDYSCGLEDAMTFRLWADHEFKLTCDVNYIKKEYNLIVSVALAADSVLTEVDFENLSVTATPQYESGTGLTGETKSFNRDGVAKFVLPSDEYLVLLEGYEVDGFFCYIQGDVEASVPEAETVNAEYTLRYVKAEATLTVSLEFLDSSVLKGDDIDDSITAEIYRAYVFVGRYITELCGTVLLNKENGWKGQITVPVKAGYDWNYEPYPYNEDYYVRLSGTEQKNYRGHFTGYEYDLQLLPGEVTGWEVKANYVRGEHKATVKVSLSEDSDMLPAELKDAFNITLEEIAEGILCDTVSHSGSTVFNHTFDTLPASDCYRLSMSYDPPRGSGEVRYDVSVQSITCIGAEERSKDLDEGCIDFVLDADCEIEVVLCAKDTVSEELTVVARFAEDSLLKAEDFPEGIKLTTTYRPAGPGPEAYEVRVGELLFSEGNNWTNTITLPGLMTKLKLEEDPEGYIGTVTLSGVPSGEDYVNPSDCPATVYADICFTEYEPCYLDVKIVFDEESDLKGADAGSFFLDINDSGTATRYEFKEGSWHQTIELNGNTKDINAQALTMALSGLARAGYNYTVDTTGKDGGYGCTFDPISELYDVNSLWDRGDTEYLEIHICYTREPGNLLVEIVNSPYGSRSPSTITLTDADGNVVAQKETGSNYDDETGTHTSGEFCVFELTEAGSYTITQSIRDDAGAPTYDEKTGITTYQDKNGEYTYRLERTKTFDFDPEVGKTITLLNESRPNELMQIRVRFDGDSVLGPDAFEEGITVTLTETTGAFAGSYVLSDENGWGVSSSMPQGSYIVTQSNADKEGYIRTTRFAFAQSFFHASGGMSLRGWDLRERSTDNGETSYIYDATGGPYYLYRGADVEYGELNFHWLDVYNTYEPLEETPTGSITITAGDGFYDFESNEELDEKPDTGSEAESYTYIVSIDGEEQTVTLKPGETFTLDGLEEGTAYSITPVLPAGYPWNASAEPITGTIGGDTEEDWNAEVSFENDYYYTHEEGVLTIVKTDALTGDKLKGAQFGLYSDKDCTKQVAKATTGKDGTCSFDLTEEGTFYIKELKAPEDYYVKSEEVKTVTVKTEWVLETREGTKVLVQKLTASVADLSQKDGGYIWENERKTTDISVTKKFAYDEDLERPESVTIVLYQDGEAYETVKLSAANNWKYVWKDMPLGFEYTVDELNVAKGYYKQIRSSGYDFTVTNSGSILPQTGDMTNIALWGVLALASIAGLAVLIYKRKKKA